MNDKINKCGCGGVADIYQNLDNNCYYYIMCQNCCNRTSEFRKKSEALTHWNGSHPEHKYFNSEQILAVLDSAHANNMITEYNVYSELHDMISCIKEEAELSPAMQAVKWLEEGNKICSNKFTKKTNIDYLFLDNGFLHSVKGGQCIKSYCLDFYDLQDNDWKLYEEPKYQHSTFSTAILYFTENEKGVSHMLHNDEYFLRYNDDRELCLVSPTNPRCYRVFDKTLLTSDKWRIYD